MTDRPYSPGERPLSFLRTGEPQNVLGGKPFQGVDADEVLGRLGMSLTEAGAIETRVHCYGAQVATAGAWVHAGLEVPDGKVWRILAACALVLQAGTNDPMLGATTNILGVWNSVVPPNVPDFVGTGGGSVVAGASPTSFLSTVLDGPGAIAKLSGHPILLKPEDVIYGASMEAGGGDMLTLFVSYVERDGDGVPPG